MLKRVALGVLVVGLLAYYFVFRTLYYTAPELERSGTQHAWFARGFEVATVWSKHADPSLVEGVTMAIDEVNAAGGPLANKIRLRQFEEHDNNTAIAQSVVADHDVLAVIGHEFESTTMPSSLTYEKHGVLFFATNSSDIRLTAHQFKYVFRESLDDQDYTHALAQYALRRGWKRVGLLFGRADHGNLASDQFLESAKALGVTVPIVRSYFHERAWREQDFRQMIGEVRATEFDALMIADELPWAGKLIVDLQKMGVTAPLMSTYKLESTNLWPITGNGANNLYVASPVNTDSILPEYVAFAVRFRQRFKQLPNADAIEGYQALKTFVQACEKSGSADPVVVATTLKTNKWTGLFGEVSFKQDGDLVGRNVEIKRMQDGVFRTVAAEKDSED